MPATIRNSAIGEQKLELLQSDIYEEWQQSLNSEATRENYSNHLAYFCRFHSVKANELEQKNVEELRSMVIKYLLHLKKNAKESSPTRAHHGEIHVNSLPVYMSGVKSFLDYLEKAIVWRKINRMLPEGIMSEVRAYTREEIQKILSVSDKRHRALELMMASGGVRRQVPAQLKIENFEVFDAANNIGMLSVYTTSKKWRYFTLLTPEATNAIQDYLAWRKEHGETLKPESPLIRDKFDVFSSRRNKPKFLNRKTILIMMERVLEQASIKDVRISPCHSFRHIFDTMLINSRIDDRMKQFWMGHKSGLGLDSRYYDPQNPESKEALLEEFLKAVNLLTIADEFRLKKQVVELKEELKDSAPKDMVADLLLQKRALENKVDKIQKEGDDFKEMVRDWMKGKLKPG